MTLVPWGNLKKSAVDDETIEQAIIRLIAVHEADETSHLGVGESLQSHKASEIIDHVALSIVEDKIKDREVSTEKLTDFARGRYSLSIESLDGWDYDGDIAIAPGEFLLQTGSVGGTYVRMFSNQGGGPAPSWDKNFEAQILFKTFYNTSQTIYAVCGTSIQNDPEDQCAGFKISDGQVLAIHRYTNGSVVTEVPTICSGIDPTVFHVYRVKFIYESKIEFYIDDVLVATHSTNLPSADFPSNSMFTLSIQNGSNFNRILMIRQLYFSQSL